MYKKKKILEILEDLRDLEIKSKEKYQYEEKQIPRVTEVISAMLHEDGLMNWSNSLGWKRISYKAYMKEAADKGTYSHLAIETYLRNGYVDIGDFGIKNEIIFNSVRNCMTAFYSWWLYIHTIHENIEIVYIEEKLVTPNYGGTCDCLLKIDGKYVLIDFKTSNNMSYSYTLQLAAYRKALKDIKEISVDKCMILQLDKSKSSYTEYVLDLDNKEHLKYIEECEETFLLLLAAFKMRMYTNEKFYSIYGIEKYKK